MKTSITLSPECFRRVANGETHKLRLFESQEPELGLVRLLEYGTENHIDINVKRKRKHLLANQVTFRFDIIGVYITDDPWRC